LRNQLKKTKRNIRINNIFADLKENNMKAVVSIIMGSTSDMPVMKKAAEFLNEMEIPFEINALSAHRVPQLVEEFASNARKNGIKVIIAGAGGAAHLPGVVAAFTTVPVIGVPCRSSISIDGWDSILSILQMPPGIPVATVGLDASLNAGILASQILATDNEEIHKKVNAYKENLKLKIAKANKDLASHEYSFRVQ
jgi:5-(carboxyamino)imidazole ribonucleotide mutase